MNPTQLDGDQLLVTLNFFDKCNDYIIEEVIPDPIAGYDNLTYDEVAEMLNLDEDVAEEWKLKYNKVTSAAFWLKKKDYNKILKDFDNLDYIKEDAMFKFFVFNKHLFIVQLIKVTSKGDRKTIEDLEVEMKDAVEVENYELAASLKKKIQIRLTKKRKK